MSTGAIPVSKPLIEEDDIEAVTAAAKSTWVSSLGSEIIAFEAEFSAYIGADFCCSCSNGTTALQLALVALGVGRDDEVIIPDFTFAAVANAVLAVGAIPICVDVSIDNWCISVEQIENMVTTRTKCIIVVHSYGIPIDVRNLKEAFPTIKLIEDCAEAHGANINGLKVGSFADCSTFSFYGNKIITTGEGGAVLTSDPEIDRRLRLYRDHGMDPNERYNHIVPGFNYRMTNIQAALGRSQLKKIEEIIHYRSIQENYYDSRLLNLGFKKAKMPEGQSVNWIYTRLVPNYIDVSELRAHLKKSQIDTRPTFKPIHQFQYMDHQGDFSNTEFLAKHGISLPTYNQLSIADQDRIISEIIKFITA